MGCVYILTNPAMPGLIKIGYTTRTAEERAKELYEGRNGNAVTGVPMPFTVAHEESCENPRELESLIHKALEASRLENPNTGKIEREFFKYQADEAYQKLKEIHKHHPTHTACLDSDGGVWRKWTSHFLTRFKRKAKTQEESSL